MSDRSSAIGGDGERPPAIDHTYDAGSGTLDGVSLGVGMPGTSASGARRCLMLVPVRPDYGEQVSARERSLRPFWLHQLGEYLVAAILVASAWYSPEPAVQATLGVAIFINAAFAKGPAGAFGLINRKVHKWFDVVIIVLLLVAAVQGWVGVGTTGRIALPLMALLMLVLWFNTAWA
jgi:hypothetical protein